MENQNNIRRMQPNIKVIVVAFLGLVATCCCKKVAESTIPSGTRDDSARVYACQTVLWFNTIKTLRKKMEDTETCDTAVLSNYFPVFILEEKSGIHNRAISKFASDVFREYGPKKARDNIWKMSSETYENAMQNGPMSSFGFNPDEIGDFESFSAARERYFEFLSKDLNLPPKSGH